MATPNEPNVNNHTTEPATLLAQQLETCHVEQPVQTRGGAQAPTAPVPTQNESDAGSPPSDTIELNVGGHPFTTTRSILCAQPDTLLASMFSGRWEGSVRRDEAGVIYLDCDSSLFGVLLQQLSALQDTQDKTIHTPPGLSSEQKEGWQELLWFWGFRHPFSASDVWELACFSEKLSHPDFKISNSGQMAIQKGSRDSVVAVVEGCVKRGEKRTWTLLCPNTFCLRFGFMPESVVPNMRENSSDEFRTDCLVIFREGFFSLAGQKGYGNERLYKEIEDGEKIRMVIDGETDPDSPYVQVVSHSKKQLPIPKEWGETGGYRFFIESSSDGTGVHILSVD